MKLNNQYGYYKNVKVAKNWSNGFLELFLLGEVSDDIFGDTEEVIAKMTVNIEKLSKNNVAYLDTKNCPWVKEFVEENELGRNTGFSYKGGRYEYPLYEFNLAKLK